MSFMDMERDNMDKALNRRGCRTRDSRHGGIGLAALLVVVGFLVGLIAFVPWRQVWTGALVAADEKLEHVDFSWSKVDRAGLFGFKARDFKITVRGGRPLVMHFQSADIRFGVNPKYKIRLNSGGPEVILDYHWSGTFDFGGSADLASLLRGDVQGSIFFEGRGELPDSGEAQGIASIKAQDFRLPDGRRALGVGLDLAYPSKKGGGLDITSFSLRKPVQIRAIGHLKLDRKSFYNSTYSVTGKATEAGKDITFRHSGDFYQIFFTGF